MGNGTTRFIHGNTDELFISDSLGVIAESVAGMPGLLSGRAPKTSSVIFDVQNQFWTLGLEPDPDLPEDERQLSALNKWGLSSASLSDVHLWLPSGLSSTLPNTVEFTLSPNQLQDTDWLALLELERYSAMGQALLTLLRSGENHLPSELASRAIPSQQLGAFQQSTLDALRWRLQALATSSLVQNPGIDVNSFLVPGRISVLLLRDVNDSLRSLIVGVLMRIFSTKMGSFHQKKRVLRRYGNEHSDDPLPERLWVFLDEAHVIAPKDARTSASDPVVDYVKRGRDAGLSLVFATQQPSAADSRLMSQVDLTITHSLGFETDLQAAIARMPTRTSVVYERAGLKLSSVADMIRSLNPGECVIADSSNGRIFISLIRPRLSAHGGNTPAMSNSEDSGASDME